MPTKLRTEEEFREAFLADLVYNAGLTDLVEGSRLTQIAGTFCRELFRLQGAIWEGRDAYYLMSADDPELDERASDILPAGMDRDSGQRAEGGALVFSRPASGPLLAQNVDVAISVGRSSDGFRYTTKAATAFALGATDSAPAVSVLASRIGVDGNTAASDIDTVYTAIEGVTGCRNTAAIANGSGRESAADFKDRIRRWVAGISRGTPDSLINAALATNDPTYGSPKFAKVAIPTEETRGLGTLYIDDGTGNAAPVLFVPPGEVLIEESAGGERYFYLRHYPIVVAPHLEWEPTGGGVAVGQGFRLVRPWGLVVLDTAMPASYRLKTKTAYHARTGLAPAVQRKIDGDVLDPLNYHGYRAEGVIMEVVPAVKHLGKDLPVEIGVVLDTDEVVLDAYADLADLVVGYINNLPPETPLYRAELSALVIANSAVKNVLYVHLNGVDQDAFPTAGTVVRTTNDDIVFK